MNSRAISLLRDSKPGSHIVYPCPDENLIAEAVATFVSSGLERAEAVILITTNSRRAVIEGRLEAQGFDLRNIQDSGQLLFMDAAELLACLIVDGMPDSTLFKNRVGLMIARASVDPTNPQIRRVRVFGEMVSLLYLANNVSAAERLEAFWDELITTYSSFFAPTRWARNAPGCIKASSIATLTTFPSRTHCPPELLRHVAGAN